MDMLIERYVSRFFSRARRKAVLDYEIKNCRRCLISVCPDQLGNSVPGFGNFMSPVFILGQSLCSPCVGTQIPFTRGSGDFLDLALTRTGLNRFDVFTTNVVHCHPPGNRESKADEKDNCGEYLSRELRLVKPSLIVCFGNGPVEAIRKLGCSTPPCRMISKKSRLFKRRVKILWVHHPAYFLYKHDPKAAESWVGIVSRSIYLEIRKKRDKNAQTFRSD